LSALAKFQTEPQQVVPILTASLSDPDRNIRALAARSLAGFGTNAQQASLTLVRLLSDPDQRVRAAATNSLKAIDPEAAAKAGVQ
jgi:HEAT repeat protein